MRLKSFIARLRDRFLVTESQPAPNPSNTGSLNKRIVSLGDTYLSVLGASVPNPSHLPEPLNSLSQAARTTPQPKDYAEEYALLRTEFDPAYYFAENPDIANTALNPIAHYMREARSKTQQRNPAPWFSDDHYIARCPEAATSELTPFGHYLSHNTGEGHTAAPFHDFAALAEILEMSPNDALAHLRQRSDDLRASLETGELGEMVEKAASHDPLIAKSWSAAMSPRILPFSSDRVVSRIVSLFRLQKAAAFRRARVVLIENGLASNLDGAPTTAFVKVLCDVVPADEIIVLQTGTAYPLLEASRYPAGVRVISLCDFCAKLDDLSMARVLTEFLRTLRCTACIFTDTPIAWNTVLYFGRQLSKSMALHAWTGPSAGGAHADSAAYMMYRCFNQLSGIWSESADFLAELRKRYAVTDPAEAARFLHLPMVSQAPEAREETALEGAGATVLGAATSENDPATDRFCAIAATMPETRFRLLLTRPTGKIRRRQYIPANVEIHAAGILSENCSIQHAIAWLDTGRAGTTSYSLRHAARNGIPIVATRRNCTDAGLDPAHCWVPAETETLAAQADALRQVIADRSGAKLRAEHCAKNLAPDQEQAALRAILQGLFPAQPRNTPSQDAGK